jgi:hypothetical protein
MKNIMILQMTCLRKSRQLSVRRRFYNIKEIIHIFYYIKYVNIVQYMNTIGLLHEYW